ncbi:MAG: alpha/beta hydrolase [Sphingomonadales bacterium]|nr:alpha/beta hydrolase [Sphingomonadales bacterium]
MRSSEVIQAITLPPLRQGRAAPADLAERRGQMQAAVDAGAWKTAKPPIETRLAGLRTLRFQPEGRPRGYVLQFHGGGFRIGRPEFESLFAEALAARCGVEVVVPQYRLAPEAPFPAGLTDALAALTALRAEAGDAPLIVGGDSAGAGLAASLGVLTAAKGNPRIDALVLLSPWLDLRVSAASYAANAATDPMFSRESAGVAAELYLQGFDPAHPLASPLLAPITAYPPTLISVGTGEVLYDDSRLFHDKLTAAGLASQLSAIAGMEHVAVVRGLAMPGAPETFAAVAAFIEPFLSR